MLEFQVFKVNDFKVVAFLGGMSGPNVSRISI